MRNFKKAALLCLPISCAILVFIVAFSFTFKNKNENVQVLKINANSVKMQEYLLFAEGEKAYVYSYFTSVHEIQPGDLNWNKGYGENRDKPLDLLIERTNKKIIDNNIVFEKAKAANIINYSTFEEITANYKADAQTRKQKKENGEVVYGPVDMELAQYYDYTLENVRAALKKQIWNEDNPNEVELLNLYNSKKETLFTKPASAKAIRVSLPIETQNSEETLNKVYEALKNSKNAEKALAEFSGLSVEEIEISPSTERQDKSIYQNLRTAVLEMGKTGIVPVTQNTSSYDIAIITEFEEEGYVPFDKNHVVIKREYGNILYEQKMAQWKGEATINQAKNMKSKILKLMGEEKNEI